MPDATISIGKVIEAKLLPIDPGSGGIQTPTFKFFDEYGLLIGAVSGAPSPTNVPLERAIRQVPKNFSNMSLKQEAALVGLSPSRGKKVVLVYVMNGRCPPCGTAVANVKSRLASVGWSDSTVAVINIAIE